MRFQVNVTAKECIWFTIYMCDKCEILFDYDIYKWTSVSNLLLVQNQ